MGEKLSLALLSRNKKECTASSSECTVEPLEHYESAHNMGMMYDGLCVAQPSIDMKEDTECGVTGVKCTD